MAQLCRVNDCGKSRKHGITLHRIPQDAGLAKKWTDFIKFSGKNLHMSVNEAIKRRVQICSDHFVAECYNSAQLRRKEAGFSVALTLIPGSVPSILSENVAQTPSRQSNRDSVRKKLQAAREKEADKRQTHARKGLDFGVSSTAAPDPPQQDVLPLPGPSHQDALTVPGPSHQDALPLEDPAHQDALTLPGPSHQDTLPLEDPSNQDPHLPCSSIQEPHVAFDPSRIQTTFVQSGGHIIFQPDYPEKTPQQSSPDTDPSDSQMNVLPEPQMPIASSVAGIIEHLQEALAQGPVAIQVEGNEPQILTIAPEAYSDDSTDSPDPLSISDTSHTADMPPPPLSPSLSIDPFAIPPQPPSPSTSDMDSIIMPPPQKPTVKRVTMCDMGVQTLLTKTIMDNVISPHLEDIIGQPESPISSETDQAERQVRDNSSDPDYVQSDIDSASSAYPTPVKQKEETYITKDNNRVYMVYEEMLLSLFLICMRCRSTATANIKSFVGTAVEIVQTCSRKGCPGYTWWSQPLIGTSKYRKGNMMLSSSILVSGSNLSKVFRLFTCLGVPLYDESTFYNHQRKYLHGAVLSTWEDSQKVLLDGCGETIEVSGDARCDSMGHTAKYGAYTLLDTIRNKILCMVLVQKNEVKSSYHMELKGLERCVAVLELIKKIKNIIIVTDRHPQINKWIKEKWTKAKHYFDIWHVAKGFKKKLDALVKKFPAVKDWAPGIVNHLYWCATTSNGDGELAVAKWKSLANHIVDVHEHEDKKFPKCLHGPLPPKLWLKPDSAAYEELFDIMTATRHLKDVSRLSPSGQTGSLEGFHSLVNHFAPKMLHFSYAGMNSRLLLAVLHYNENSDRSYKVTKEGKESWNAMYPRSRGQKPLVRRMKEDATHGYTKIVAERVIYLVNNPKKAEELEKEIKDSTPVAPSKDLPQMDKESEIEKHKTRFAQPDQA